MNLQVRVIAIHKFACSILSSVAGYMDDLLLQLNIKGFACSCKSSPFCTGKKKGFQLHHKSDLQEFLPGHLHEVGALAAGANSHLPCGQKLGEAMERGLSPSMQHNWNLVETRVQFDLWSLKWRLFSRQRMPCILLSGLIILGIRRQRWLLRLHLGKGSSCRPTFPGTIFWNEVEGMDLLQVIYDSQIGFMCWFFAQSLYIWLVLSLDIQVSAAL